MSARTKSGQLPAVHPDELPPEERRPTRRRAGVMFCDFIDETVAVGDHALRVRRAGDGPAVLLLHGHPRIGSTWHRVAPELVSPPCL
jgi:hypothetical protein